MKQRGPGSKHAVCVSAVRLHSPSFEQLLKRISSSYIYVRLERSSSETNDRAPRTLKKKNTFMRKKRIKENKEKKEGRPFALTESYFF